MKYRDYKNAKLMETRSSANSSEHFRVLKNEVYRGDPNSRHGNTGLVFFVVGVIVYPLGHLGSLKGMTV